jgi:hypothetical protein
MQGEENALRMVVLQFAAAWRDHPDYDPAWSPGERMTP